ncbi:MAG: HEPN domain-containing protein [Elusimicrobia bacterium]|nr:HEPN domain-containing protein [Elusimicrobiota bacterium]
MPNHKVAEEWAAKAGEDFAFAGACLEEEISFFAQICFFFQQAAEKYLKAYIVAKGLEFRKIHDLIELLETCAKQDASFHVLKDACKFVNRFYVDTRYPVHWPSDFTRQDAEQAKESACEIAEFIKEKIR